MENQAAGSKSPYRKMSASEDVESTSPPPPYQSGRRSDSAPRQRYSTVGSEMSSLNSPQTARKGSRNNKPQIEGDSPETRAPSSTKSPISDKKPLLEYKPRQEEGGNQEGNDEQIESGGLKSMPKAIWYIVFNEACERFTYYGLSGILALFLKDQLGYTTSLSSAIVLYFQAIVYFSPLIGGYFSDSYFGKFKIIMSFSVIYVIGTLGLAGSAINQTQALTFVSLFLIGFGTGGIKPCVSSFGADQLPQGPGLAKRTETFFAVFYFSINTGSVLAFIAPPYISEYDKLGYPYAFGLPAVFMIISIFIIWSGRHLYWHAPINGSVISQVYRVIKSALRRRKTARRAGDANLPHWLDYAKNDHGKEAVFDTKAVVRLMPIMAMLPIFWTLYNQQQSVWVLQAESMDLEIGSFHVAAASVQLVNPILIMIYLPLFDQVVYPFFTRIGLHPRPLRRMAVGMLLAAVAFLLSAGVQQLIDSSEPNSVSIFYQFPQIIVISAAEILVSVTSLEFSYAEAPITMKSMISAINLLTTSIGALLAALVYSSLGGVLEQKYLLVLFAALMFLNMLAFMVVANFYVYVRDEKNRSAIIVSTSRDNSGGPARTDESGSINCSVDDKPSLV